MKIYIFRPGQLGDSLNMVPVILTIRKIHPNSNFVLITDKPPKKHFVFSWEVFKHFDFFEKVIPYSKNMVDLLKIMIELRRNPNSILYFLAVKSKWGKFRDKLFYKYICGVKKIVGLEESYTNLYRRKSNGFLVKSIKDSEKFIRIVERYHKVKIDRPKGVLLPIKPDIVKNVDSILAPFINEIERASYLISIGAGSKMPAKKWFHDRYAEICNRLIEQKNAFLIFLGGKEEYDEIEELIKNVRDKKKVLNLAGKTSIIESAEILKRSNLYLGNDTGIMHLAAIVGVKCLAIFSARNSPGRWDPYGDNHVVLLKRIYCEGCMLEVCNKNNKCLDMISIEEVWEKLKIVL